MSRYAVFTSTYVKNTRLNKDLVDLNQDRIFIIIRDTPDLTFRYRLDSDFFDPPIFYEEEIVELEVL